MASELRREFEFYLANQEWLVKEYDGKCVVIKEGRVLGVYENELAAVTETQKEHDLGTFLVQKVTEGDSAYSQTFHSRVAFP